MGRKKQDNVDGVQIKDEKPGKILSTDDYAQAIIKRNEAMREGAFKVSEEKHQVQFADNSIKTKFIKRVEVGGKKRPLCTKTYVTRVDKRVDGKTTTIRGA